MAFTETQETLLIVGIPAAVTVAIAVVSSLWAYLASTRERRRKMYGEAFRAALSWGEMLYRVRRRAGGQEADQRLVARFHELQEELDFYTGWIGSESKYLQLSYQALIDAVKGGTRLLIADAWKAPVREPCSGTLDTDMHPDLKAAQDRFLRDVRSHLSPWPWRKMAVAVRNRSEGEDGRR